MAAAEAVAAPDPDMRTLIEQELAASARIVAGGLDVRFGTKGEPLVGRGRLFN